MARNLDVWFRSTLGFRKEGEAWKIAHGHGIRSHANGRNLKAAIDLEP